MRRDYLTPKAAASDWLGWDGPRRGRRLVSLLLAKEAEIGRAIMVRAGGKLRRRYLVTRPMLERYCPELFLATADELTLRIPAAIARIEDRLESIVDDRLEPQLRELRAADDRLGDRVAALERVRQILG
jgi:hypothetical protein